MAKKMVGISSAGSALPSTDMSTDANDLSSGFDISVQSEGRQELQGVSDGAGGKINSSMPADLQGPHGFNMQRMNQSAQNTVTNVNTAGVNTPSMSFGAADFPYDSSPDQNKTGRDSGHNAADGSRGLNLDDSAAKSDY